MIANNVFLIYQLKDTKETRDYRFESFGSLKSAGYSVDKENYDHMYTASLESDTSLERIFTQFNCDIPTDFIGHSLSVSDVIVLYRDGVITAHYVDSVGFVDVPEFLNMSYRYYSTQRPISVGTFPKMENNLPKIINFNKRTWEENATFQAWGYIMCTLPLTQSQVNDYELRAASDNPYVVQISPYQLEAQIQVVGRWEQSKCIPDRKRLTWWHDDFGVFVKKDFITNERLTEQFKQI